MALTPCPPAPTHTNAILPLTGLSPQDSWRLIMVGSCFHAGSIHFPSLAHVQILVEIVGKKAQALSLNWIKPAVTRWLAANPRLRGKVKQKVLVSQWHWYTNISLMSSWQFSCLARQHPAELCPSAAQVQVEGGNVTLHRSGFFTATVFSLQGHGVLFPSVWTNPFFSYFLHSFFSSLGIWFLKNSVIIAKQEVLLEDNQVEGRTYFSGTKPYRSSKESKRKLGRGAYLLIWLPRIRITQAYLWPAVLTRSVS